MTSLVHTDSCETVKEELDLFSDPPSQTSLEKGKYIQYNSVSILSNNGPVEFLIPGESSFFFQTLYYMFAQGLKNKTGQF